MRFVIDQYTPVAVAASTSCSTPTCIALASGSGAASLQDVLVGGLAALQREKTRFDLSLQAEMLQRLETDTFDYLACADAGCRAAAAARTNASFAVHGYVNQAVALGFRLADDQARARLVALLAANFTRCVMTAGACTAPEVNGQLFSSFGRFVRVLSSPVFSSLCCSTLFTLCFLFLTPLVFQPSIARSAPFCAISRFGAIASI